MDRELSEEEEQELLAWVDEIPLSRPRRIISRDFSDGVLAAEVVRHFFPKLVDLHNYPPANKTEQKRSNWRLLNRRVFSKLEFHVPEEVMNRIVMSTPGVITSVLRVLKEKIKNRLEQTTTNMLSYSYNERRNENPHSVEEMQQAEARLATQLEEIKNNMKNLEAKLEGKQTIMLQGHIDPALKRMLLEKEQEILALREAFAIQQMALKKQEDLIRLKDMRIERLRHQLDPDETKSGV